MLFVLLALAQTPDAIRAKADALRAGDTDGWRRIPWAATLPDAVALAKKEGRPLFLFSHEGNIDTGRC